MVQPMEEGGTLLLRILGMEDPNKRQTVSEVAVLA